ncbi:hypothetical protein JHK85_010288 [Glycine max]|nr:hypothetical protein JHK85_010288 [Glycine max]
MRVVTFAVCLALGVNNQPYHPHPNIDKEKKRKVSSLEKTSALALGSQYKSNGIVTQSSSTENNDKKVMSIGSGLMSTWEDMDDTLFDKDYEEANICLMADIALEESKLDQEDEVNFDDPESLRKAYHELPSNSFILSKIFKK